MNNLFVFYALLMGLTVGSFLSMLIPRLHNKEDGIAFGRSKCPKCKHKLKAANLIPLISFIIQKGKCAYCKKKISLAYPVIELTSVLSFFILYLNEPEMSRFIISAMLFSFLILIFFYDLFYQETHDAFMLPAILLAFAASIWQNQAIDSFYGAVIGSVFFGLQWLMSKGKWVGSGDIRIGAFMGFTLGWQNTIAALLLSYVLGTIASLYLLATKKASGKSMIPLGPFLVLGTVTVFFYGHTLIDWYLHFMI